MSLIKDLKSSLSRIEAAELTWKGSLLKELMTLRKEGVTTDTRVMVVGEEGSTTLLAHSLVLAAASPTLATILSSCSQEEDFTLVLPGGDANMVEQAINSIYQGKESALGFLREWGLLGEEKEEVKEECKGEGSEGDNEDSWEDDGSHFDGGKEEEEMDVESTITESTIIDLFHDNIDKEPVKEKEVRSSRSVRKCYTEVGDVDEEPKDKGEKADDPHDAWKPTEEIKINNYVIKLSEGGLLACPECDKEFRTKTGLRFHLAREHTNDEKEHEDSENGLEKTGELARSDHGNALRIGKHAIHVCEDGKVKCPFPDCDKTFCHKRGLRTHMESKHDLLTPSQKLKRQEREEQRDSFVELGDIQAAVQKDGRVQCPECDKSIVKQFIKKHYESIHQKLKATCEHCGGEFSKIQLKRHITRMHSTIKFDCALCDYRSTVKDDIRAHMQSKHSNTRHICDECGQDYCSVAVLEQHRRMKHNGKIFCCDKCDFKTDGTMDQLKSHIRLLHEASKFICKFCPFESGSSEALEEHKQGAHLDELMSSPSKSNEQKRREKELQMDFNCKECDHKISTRQGLAFHIRATHRGIRFHCPEDGCDWSGTQNVNLQTHIDSKHRGIRHYCDMCDFSGVSKTNVRVHKLGTHKVSAPIFACDKCKYRSQDAEKMRKHMVNLHS